MEKPRTGVRSGAFSIADSKVWTEHGLLVILSDDPDKSPVGGGDARQAASSELSAAAGQGGACACGIGGFAGVRGGWRSVRRAGRTGPIRSLCEITFCYS